MTRRRDLDAEPWKDWEGKNSRWWQSLVAGIASREDIDKKTADTVATSLLIEWVASTVAEAR